jgi:hypothetical protein
LCPFATAVRITILSPSYSTILKYLSDNFSTPQYQHIYHQIAKMHTQPDLSKNDTSVLSQIFNPESNPTLDAIVDPSLPSDPNVTDSQILSTLRAQETDAIRLIERLQTPESKKEQERNPNLREEGFSEALSTLTAISNYYANYASVRNNRAQLLTLQHGHHIIVHPSTNALPFSATKAAEMAFADLNEAIKLLSPSSSPDGKLRVSAQQQKTLRAAYMQRATLLYTASRDLKESGEHAQIVVEALKDWTQARFEEACSRDFFMGGRYGDALGKEMAQLTDPYAKLCGNIVKEAMRREREPGVAV